MPDNDLLRGRVLVLASGNWMIESRIRSKFPHLEIAFFEAKSQRPALELDGKLFDLIIIAPFLHELNQEHRTELLRLATASARPKTRLLIATITEPLTRMQCKVFPWAEREAAATELLSAANWKRELASHGLRSIRYKGEVASWFFQVTIIQATTADESDRQKARTKRAIRN